jgi:hypothetical protein
MHLLPAPEVVAVLYKTVKRWLLWATFCCRCLALSWLPSCT